MKIMISENENGSMTFREFREKMIEVYHSKFPDSKCGVRLWKGLGRSIVINCFLANSASELSGGYAENDMFNICFWIHDLPDNFEVDDVLPDVMTMTNHNSGMLIAPESRYLAYDSVKIPYRKTTGNADKIIASFRKYVDRLYTIINQQIANGKIAKDFADIVSKKVV